MPKQAKSSIAKVRQTCQEYLDEFWASPAGDLRCNLCDALVKCDKKFFVVSKKLAKKISAISQSCEKLITKERTPLGIALSLTVLRITGRKEVTTLLNRCGVGIPYTDVRYLNNNWAKFVTMDHKKMLPAGFIRGRSVHVTFDNSDSKQQTLIGAHTTHHTTGTIFQTRHPGDQEVITVNIGCSSVNNEEEPDYGTFKISKNKRNLFPPSFPGFSDEYKDSLLRKDALACNIAWVLLSAIGDNCLKEYFSEVSKDVLGSAGSWTSFMKSVTSCSTTRCKLEYWMSWVKQLVS